MILKFNKPYKDHELGRRVEADEEVEMTVKRAKALVRTIRESGFKGYEDFDFEKVGVEEE